MKKVYLKDIAKDLNISKTTVSLVLNNKGDENKISQDTQKRILDYAKKLKYVPNQLARSLSRGKSETIGLIIPNISDTFYANIAGYIERKAKLMGYNVIFSSSYEDPKKERALIQSMRNRQVDGLIIASTQQNLADIKELREDDFPFVLIDRHYPDYSTDYVVVDNFGGCKTATEHLLGLGRQRIGFITLQPSLEAIAQRLLGYQKALSNGGIVPRPEWIKELSIDHYEEEIPKAISDLLKLQKPIDAILFSTHYLTALGLRTLKKLGIRMPQEVAIVSFDEMDAFDLLDPPITSVIQPTPDIGNTAVALLLERMEGKRTAENEKRVLNTTLQIRKSCGHV